MGRISRVSRGLRDMLAGTGNESFWRVVALKGVSLREVPAHRAQTVRVGLDGIPRSWKVCPPPSCTLCTHPTVTRHSLLCFLFRQIRHPTSACPAGCDLEPDLRSERQLIAL
jgi:hypothetical protein